MITGARAVTILAATITAYEVVADDDQLITAVIRRARHDHGRAAHAAVTIIIAATAAHLLDLIPTTIDPYRALGAARAAARSLWPS